MNIGDKVLCIDDKGFDWIHPTETPKTGEIYTIRNFHEHEGTIGLHLQEIVNPKRHFATGRYTEPGFLIVRFMPWNPEEEEISIMEERVLVNP